jgi:parvulin-like peptidyl-prolyl isomerase
MKTIPPAPVASRGSSLFEFHRSARAPVLPRVPAAWLLLLLGLTACQKDAVLRPDNPFAGPNATNLVARVAGEPIRREALEQVLARRGSGAEKAKGLEELITSEAIYAKAKAARFDQTPEVAAAIKLLIIAKYQEDQSKDDTASSSVTKQDVTRYYQDHLADYATPEKIRAAVIFIAVPSKATPDKQAEYTARADAILAEARQLPPSPPTFEALAAKHSDDQASRYQGGDIGWLMKGQQSPWGEAVADAVFALSKPGDLSPVLRTRDGLVLARLMERQSASTRPLSELKDGIAYRLSRLQDAQREQAFHAAMKAGLKIDINQPLLDSLTRPIPPEPQPPSLPGTKTALSPTPDSP